MRKMYERTIFNTKLSGTYRHTDPEEDGKVELFWLITVTANKSDWFIFKIFINRFEVFVMDGEPKGLKLVVPIKGDYKNNYVLSEDRESADKAFEAAYGLYRALSQTECTEK